MNLFMISLGGKVNGCNLEVHDVQFVAAKHIDDTLKVLRSGWYGREEKLHMDSYKQISGADGYTLRLTKEKPDSRKQLFFVHLGGYQKDSSQELHEVGLLVGDTLQEVKERAPKEIQADAIQNHVDNIISVEACLHSTDGEQYYIELSESPEEFDFAPDWFGYRRLDQTN